MFEQNGAVTWEKMLKENFNVSNQEKLNWVSQYAAIHEIHESQLGINTGNVVSSDAHPGVNPLYATPMNTVGMGNPYAPSQLDPMSTAPYNAANPTGSFWGQTPGSGDIPVSTLPMALNIALLTIGLELVPVIPSKGPWAMLTYMDFPYAGGKLGLRDVRRIRQGNGTGNELGNRLTRFRRLIVAVFCQTYVRLTKANCRVNSISTCNQ